MELDWGDKISWTVTARACKPLINRPLQFISLIDMQILILSIAGAFIRGLHSAFNLGIRIQGL